MSKYAHFIFILHNISVENKMTGLQTALVNQSQEVF